MLSEKIFSSGQRKKSTFCRYFFPHFFHRENKIFGKSHPPGVKLTEYGMCITRVRCVKCNSLDAFSMPSLLGSVHFLVVNPTDAWAEESCSNIILNCQIFFSVYVEAAVQRLFADKNCPGAVLVGKLTDWNYFLHPFLIFSNCVSHAYPLLYLTGREGNVLQL